ncbi:T9SS type A sorting domain-containing protein [Taibaiella lutea]|uniref:T9SS type A sorting domain-containing protein n=1 Tax=Taibaiella lutea TaxID=2608001 RepID=A0A5M6CK78_9BACT|nr:plastocyanin/azurin family copper-binding protein [Taibaiella lutea]KAA5534840.1 T9SS type A sorting domain-containing protein [Taibaiella lutea]
MHNNYKHFTWVFLVLITFSTVNKLHATNHTVLVGGSSGMSFVPSSLSFPLGDTITWVWDAGFHTTTSINIPGGAASWDQQITTSGDSYSYVPTIVGTYEYNCTYHAPMMSGTFTVTSAVSETNHIVLVGGSDGMSFVPASLSFPLGDTITWVWDVGHHTTTSINIPAGAASWDQPLATSGDTYSYVPTEVGTYEYDCTIHAPMMAGTFIVSTPLPLNITSFHAGAIDSGARLDWAMAASGELSYFVIERSGDGKKYESIREMKASAESKNKSTSYFYIDKNWLAGLNYYRLKSVNVNGKFQYSNVVSIENTKDGNQISIIQNPVTRILSLKITELKNDIKIQVMDLNGKEIMNKTVASYFSGQYDLNVAGIAAGQYILQVSGLSSNLSFKFVKQ